MGQVIDVPGYGPTEFPDGMTDAQIVAAIKFNPPPKQAPEPSLGTKAARIAGQVGQGFNEAAYNAVMALPDASAWISRKAGLVPEDTPRPSAALRGAGASTLGITKPVEFRPETEAERIAQSVGTAAGDVAGVLAPVGIAANAAKAGTATKGVLDALRSSPVQQTGFLAAGNAVGEATDNPLIGTATSLALPALTHGAVRAVRAAPAANTQEAERRGLLETGREIGAPLSAGKITGSSKLQTAESAMVNNPLPFIGGRTAGTEGANRDAWQKAILEKTGQVGETGATRNVTEAVENRLSQGFESITKGNTITVTPKFGTDLDGIKAEYRDRLFEDVRPGLMRRIDELRAGATTSAEPGAAVTLDGRTYQNIRSDLSRISGTAPKPADRQAARAMVDALDDMAGASLPRDVMGDWAQLRQQWRNLAAIKGAMKSANNDQTAIGNIPTAAFSRLSKGNPELERLGQYGAAMVGDKIPNSGTSSRLFGTAAVGLPGAIASGQVPMNTATMAAAAGLGTPYALDAMINNPLTRKLLLSRYRNAGESPINPGLFGALSVENAR